MQINQAAVIGCGGTGQQLIPSLIRLLNYHDSGTTSFTAYDGDQFEEHNAERQIGSTGSKADSLNDLLRLQHLDRVCVDRYISKPALERIRRSTDGMLLVVAAVDNDATRKMCIEVLDAADGELARLKQKPSYIGRYFDSVSDIILNFFFLATICYIIIGSW